MTVEFWMPVLGYEGAYAVSDAGRVKSLPRKVARKNGSLMTVGMRVLKPGKCKSGYLLVSLAKGGKTASLYVHRIVIEAFTRKRLDGDADHRDKNIRDNRLSNLRVAHRWQNNGNSDGRIGTSSIFKGVTKWPDGRWRAQICSRHIGLYNNEQEAARAYDVAARAHFGPFAQTNFDTAGVAP